LALHHPDRLLEIEDRFNGHYVLDEFREIMSKASSHLLRREALDLGHFGSELNPKSQDTYLDLIHPEIEPDITELELYFTSFDKWPWDKIRTQVEDSEDEDKLKVAIQCRQKPLNSEKGVRMLILENQPLVDLIEEGRKKGFIAIRRVLELMDEDSEEFDELSRILENENIDLVKDEDLEEYEIKTTEEEVIELEDLVDFEEDIESDPEFDTFSNEIEHDIKSKDIDDIVSSIVSPSQTDDPIKMYLREIGQIDLLTTYQEVDLSRKVQDGLLSEERMKLNKKGKRSNELTDDDLHDIEEKIDAGRRARDVLIESNLRLVVSIAKRYLGRGMQFQDLIQEGNMGLMKQSINLIPSKALNFQLMPLGGFVKLLPEPSLIKREPFEFQFIWRNHQ
jgi:hypothetical protein